MDDTWTAPVLFWPSLAAAAAGAAILGWNAWHFYRARQQHRNRWTTEE